jgi:membrane-associated protease RseP (regulator of RpoE activity)
MDLAIARTSRSTAAPGIWMLYSPILHLVGPLEIARLAVEHPTWSGVAWGLFVADSDLSGPALVVQVVGSHPAARAGLGPGDRLVSLGGTQVLGSQQVRRILAVASANAPLDAEWLSPDGTAHRGQLSGTKTARLVPGSSDAAGAMVRAAWAVVDSVCDSELAPVATANLALLLSDFERHELAVQTWKRVVLPERAGIGHGTVQYYLGRALERLGQEREAIRAHTAASTSEATAFDDEGPAVAPAARDRLADLGVSTAR